MGIVSIFDYTDNSDKTGKYNNPLTSVTIQNSKRVWELVYNKHTKQIIAASRKTFLITAPKEEKP